MVYRGLNRELLWGLLIQGILGVFFIGGSVYLIVGLPMLLDGVLLYKRVTSNNLRLIDNFLGCFSYSTWIPAKPA